MKKWHDSLTADIGLRLGGVALLGLGGATAFRLHHMALGMPAREPNSVMLLLAAIVFLCGSAGSALLFVGSGLWATVEVSERWRRLPPPDVAGATKLDRAS